MCSLALLVGGLPAIAQAARCPRAADDAEMSVRFKTAGACLRAATVRLEPSGEAPETVFKAAISECRAEFIAIQDLADRCFHTFWNPGVVDAVAFGNGAYATAQQNTIRRIVEIRAARAAGSPAAASGALSPVATAPGSTPTATPPAQPPK